jgi:SAM-dependent methyltransferase
MKKTQLFASIAEFYDYSMVNNCDYEGWARYVTDKLKKYLKSPAIGMDVACGSGYFTRAIKRCGYNVFGMDIAPEMLTSAQKITAQEGLFISYMVGDMTNFKYNTKLDFITAINDAINCLPPDKILKTFKNFASLLKKGGVLHFDVSSEYKLRNVIADNTFCEDDEDYSYIWFNKPYDDRVEMEMSVFLRENDKYIKRESQLIEYIHTKEFLIEALNQAGFKVFEIDGDMSEYTQTSHRINFTAIKD